MRLDGTGRHGAAGPGVADGPGGLASGIGIEFGRKIWSPADEIPGVESYSRLWGYRRATVAWATVLAAAAACALCAAGLTLESLALVLPVALVVLGGAPGVVRFMKTAGVRRGPAHRAALGFLGPGHPCRGSG